MYSVTDIAGLNKVSCKIIGNAANGIAGMVKNRELIPAQEEHKPLVAITMFGVTTKGVMCVRRILERHGFDIIVFHCTGSGGRAMERMIESGLINGVVDYTTAELNGHYITGMNDAGEERMTAASKKKIPQIIVPGAIEVCNFPGMANVPEEYRKAERKLIEHNSLICAAKASEKELIMLGNEFAKKAKIADARYTKVLFPLNGLDSYEAENGPWHDREEDGKLFQIIREGINGRVPIEEVDANINDTEFAEKVAENFLNIWELTQKNTNIEEY